MKSGSLESSSRFLKRRFCKGAARIKFTIIVIIVLVCQRGVLYRTKLLGAMAKHNLRKFVFLQWGKIAGGSILIVVDSLYKDVSIYFAFTKNLF